MRAKTNSKLIIILNAIISVVFAFIIGVSYALPSFTLNVSTNKKDTVYTGAYLANNSWSIINDTLDNPILFGAGTHITQVGIQYSIDYEFEARVQYSLSWKKADGTAGGNSDNVILNFADRDNLIVDKNYIYHTTALSGEGTLSLITSVDFVDPNDNSYVGQSLTINILDVTIEKTQTIYSESSTLYTNSEAGKAWLKYKKRSEIPANSAYFMVYNYRYDAGHGVRYPKFNTAYNELGSWLGGNKFYAGLGLYVITGSSSVKIQAKVTGSWELVSGDAAFTYENNVLYNYKESWAEDAGSDLFKTYHYNYVIPANTTCYIEILDSVEITSILYSADNEAISFDNYALVNQVSINNTVIDNTNSTTEIGEMGEYITSGYISTVSEVSATTNYTKEDITINNTSKFNNGLYQYSKGLQTFSTSVSVTNNLSTRLYATVSYQLVYYYSNGKNDLKLTYVSCTAQDAGALQVVADDATISGAQIHISNVTGVDNVTIGSYVKLVVSTNETQWRRVVHTNPTKTGGGTYLTIDSGASVVNQIILEPHTTSSIAVSYNVSADLIQHIYANNNNVNADVWVELVPNVTTNTSGSAKSNLQFEYEVKVVDSNTELTLAVKNLSNTTVSGLTATIASFARLTEEFTYNSSKPTNFNTYFWQYYYINGSNFVAYNTKEPAGATYYYLYNRTYSYVTHKSVDVATYGSTLTGSTITNTSTLQPNERIDIAKYVFNGASKITNSVGENSTYISDSFIINGVLTATSSTTPNSIDVINKGTKDTFIKNNSINSYFVRFSGTYTGSNTSVQSVGGYNYYIGLVRPGQVLAIPVSGNVTVEFKISDNTYTATTLTNMSATGERWSSAPTADVLLLYNTYFGLVTNS